jgi:hypothetical protein
VKKQLNVTTSVITYTLSYGSSNHVFLQMLLPISALLDSVPLNEAHTPAHPHAAYVPTGLQ